VHKKLSLAQGTFFSSFLPELRELKSTLIRPDLVACPVIEAADMRKALCAKSETLTGDGLALATGSSLEQVLATVAREYVARAMKEANG